MRRTREQVIWDFVHDWVRKAESDLRAAEHLMELEQALRQLSMRSKVLRNS
jgi:hypothetical protein